MNAVLAIVIGYLFGSIPFGLLLTRAVGIDIRKVGSGNIGATNVLRTGNRSLAAATLLLDAGKAAAAVIVARAFFTTGPESAGVLIDQIAVYGAGIAAFLGHLFPVWLKFKGGKGVASYIGVLLAWHWPVGLAFCATWLVIAFARKYSSLAALTAAATAPLFAYGLGQFESSALSLAAACALLSLLLYYRHWQNIRRLIAGTEPKIGSEKKAG